MADCPEELRTTLFCDDRKKYDEKTEEYWKSYAIQLASSSVLPMVMQAIIQLGVLEIISKAGAEGISADHIASQLELTKDATKATTSSMLDRMLCLLVSHSVLTCSTTTTNDNNQTTDKRKLFGLGPAGIHFVPNSDGVSFAPFMLCVQDKVFMDNWAQVKPAVMEGGIPFNKVHGMHAYEYLDKDPRFNVVFNTAMDNTANILVSGILKTYKGFEQLLRVVDVGGNLGVTLSLITKKYPQIEGINFDLPHVIQHAQHYSGVEHVAGDMFESVPHGDAILLKSVLHNWGDEHCLKLLNNCHKALSDNGKVIIVEGILPVVPDTTLENKLFCQLDMIMMTQTLGGKQRTKEEYLSLAKSAGFASTRFECVVCNFWVMEFYK